MTKIRETISGWCEMWGARRWHDRDIQETVWGTRWLSFSVTALTCSDRRCNCTATAAAMHQAWLRMLVGGPLHWCRSR